jgi:hypothetical protein
VAAAGYSSALFDLWREERPTLFSPTSKAYQLDHVLVTVGAGVADGRLDSLWQTPQQVLDDRLSDHSPVWFTGRV